MLNKFLLELDADPKYVRVVRDYLTDVLDFSGLRKEDTYYVEMGINELCENIIRHAYDPGEAGRISIKINIGSRKVTVVIVDSGKAFNPLEYKPMSTKTLVEKGIKGKLGIRTIQTVADSIVYKRLKGKNRLTFIRHTKKEKAGG